MLHGILFMIDMVYLCISCSFPRYIYPASCWAFRADVKDELIRSDSVSHVNRTGCVYVCARVRLRGFFFYLPNVVYESLLILMIKCAY